VRRGAPGATMERPGPAVQRRLIGRHRRHGHLVPPVAGERMTQQAAEDASETPPEQAVDDEVCRRVDDDQQVAEVRRVDEWVRTVLVLRLLDRLEHGEHAVWRVTQYDHHDDDDDDFRDVLLLRTAHNTEPVDSRGHSNCELNCNQRLTSDGHLCDSEKIFLPTGNVSRLVC